MEEDGRVPPDTEDLTRIDPLPDDVRYGQPYVGTGEFISFDFHLKVNSRLFTVVPSYFATVLLAFYVLDMESLKALITAAIVIVALDQPQLASRTLQGASNIINRLRNSGDSKELQGRAEDTEADPRS